MKKYSSVFKYLGSYRKSILWYFISILFSIIFSIISIGMLLPFMQLIFNVQQTGLPKATGNPVIRYLSEQLDHLISNGDKLHGLAIVCILIIISIFLKNLFLYLSYRAMGPVKNGIVNHFRIDLYNKILQLPIGYFTEKRKGDLMSRITNDVGEIEGSVVGTLEGWVRDPLTILINLSVLFYISPMLTAVILLCIPVMGFEVWSLGFEVWSLTKQNTVIN